VRRGIEFRFDRRERIEIVAQHDRAVSVDVDPGNRTRPLRDNAFERRSARQLGSGRKIRRAAQDSGGRRVRVAVRQASDSRCHSGYD
jgi:hypothetical protein